MKMTFKSVANPAPSAGLVIVSKKLVQPNQAMSLEEIISRFTRGEKLAIGREMSYHESDDDLEKVSTMDLVDREEYVDKLKETQKEYDKQEKRRVSALQKKLREEALSKIESEERLKKAGSAGDSKVIP